MKCLLRVLPAAALLVSSLAEPPKVAPLLETAPKIAFLRTKDTGLQTLSAEYKSASGKGPAVWLVGVSHIGTQEYYNVIQKRLDGCTVVLYEGVDGARLAQGAKTEAGIQTQLANALGLKFQLDAMDYKRAHFINSDLTLEKLNDAVAKRTVAAEAATGGDKSPAAQSRTDSPAQTPAVEDGAPKAPALPKVDGQTFDSLMGAIRGEGELAESLSGIVSMMGSTPEMRETTKLMLVEALGQAGEIIDLAKGASPELKNLFDVLLTERNAEVLRELDAQIAKLKAGESVAIFYGAAHMDEIAKRLTTQLHYTPARQEWDTAFSADASKSFMPAAQVRMMIQMMRTQMANPGAMEGSTEGLQILNLFGQPPATPAPGAPAKKP